MFVHRQGAQPHAGGREIALQSAGAAMAVPTREAAGASGLSTRYTSTCGLVHPEIAIVVEVALLECAVLQGDGAVQSGAQAEQEASLDLRLDGARLMAMPQSIAATARRSRTSPCGVTSASTMRQTWLPNGEPRATPRPTRGEGRPSPIRSCVRRARALPGRVSPWRATPGGSRSDPFRGMGQLVHEAFDHEEVVRRPTPRHQPSSRPRACHAGPIHVQVRNGVRRLRGALDDVVVHAVLAIAAGIQRQARCRR